MVERLVQKAELSVVLASARHVWASCWLWLSSPAVRCALALIFKDDLSQRLHLGMGDAQRDAPDAEAVRDVFCFAGEGHGWAAAVFAHDFQVYPADPAPPARSQRLHGRFFCGKTPRVALKFVLEPFAVGNFLGGEDALQKSSAVALNGALDALHFGDIHAQTDDQAASRMQRAPARWYCCRGNTGNMSRPLRQRGKPAPIILILPMGSVHTSRRKGSKRKATPKRAAPQAWTTRARGGLRILQVPAFSRIPWLVHGFSTRVGGASTITEKTHPHKAKMGHANGKRVLNLGFTEWDSRETVRENRRRLQSALNAQEFNLAPLLQFHSDSIELFEAAPKEPCRADASITNRSGLLLAVQTADCVPILLVDPKKRAVAAVHAGWRGTLQRILTKTIGRMQMQFGSEPGDLLAAMGPAIGACCYEVGTEVASAFAAKFANAAEWFDELRTGDEPNPLQWLNMMPPGHQPPPKKVLLDLRKANRAQLLEAGLRPESLFVSDLCTACRGDLLFSYRKEGAQSGRMMAVIGIRPS